MDNVWVGAYCGWSSSWNCLVCGIQKWSREGITGFGRWIEGKGELELDTKAKPRIQGNVHEAALSVGPIASNTTRQPFDIP